VVISSVTVMYFNTVAGCGQCDSGHSQSVGHNVPCDRVSWLSSSSGQHNG
jgi:hypothetical protein